MCDTGAVTRTRHVDGEAAALVRGVHGAIRVAVPALGPVDRHVLVGATVAQKREELRVHALGLGAVLRRIIHTHELPKTTRIENTQRKIIDIHICTNSCMHITYDENISAMIQQKQTKKTQ